MADDLFARAATLHQAGKLVEARILYEQLLQQDANQIYGLNLLGVTYIQADASRQSIPFFEKAIAIKPDFAEAYCNLGVALNALERYPEAIRCCEKALSIKPGYAQAYYNLAVAFNALKRVEDTIACYRKAVSIKPDYLEAYNNLGIALSETGNLDEAAGCYGKALAVNPDFPFAHCNMGGIHLLQENHNLALASFRRALELRPNYVEAQIGLAKAYLALERLSDAKAAALLAVQEQPDNANAFALLGNIYLDLADTELALIEFDSALKFDPTCDDALIGMGNLCMQSGRVEEAEMWFYRVLALRPAHVAARAKLAQIRPAAVDDGNFMALQTLAEKSTGLADGSAIDLHFALGKCYADTGDTARAFPHFRAGARLKRSKFHYSADRVSEQFDALIQFFDEPTLARLRGAGDPSRVPIFVLGMPRSGTTLTEQIIASHPDVFGAGELTDLFDLVQRDNSSAAADVSFLDRLRGLDASILADWGADYALALRRRAPHARHITDKMPANFLLIGLIHLMLPNAKIIHVRRDPIDCCLSCFTHLFRGGQQAQTYDLVELGRYYRDYARLMDHWRRVLPAGAFLEVQYEDIAIDLAAQTRRLIAYCGLQWNDACLSFHKNQRPVRTASLLQVRQPIYTSSIGRWRLYESFLQPLLEALGDLVPK